MKTALRGSQRLVCRAIAVSSVIRGEDEAIGSYTTLTGAAATAERHEEALSILDGAIKVDPVCEDLIRRAMVAEVALGRRAAALTRFRRFEAALDEQLGVEPDAETQALAQGLLGGLRVS